MKELTNLTPPEPDEIEISIFGPGFGEAILVHLGSGDWITVDSCLNPDTHEPIAVDYLTGLKIDLTKSVKAVFATHWDDDHINGISKIVAASTSAKFVCTSAFKEADFRSLVSYWLPNLHSCGSGLEELSTIMKLLRKREGSLGRPETASENKIVLERMGIPRCEIRALSPSSAGVEAAIARLSSMVPARLRRRLPKIEDNHASIVLSVRIENRSILLGADMQVRSDRKFGWLAIVDAFEKHPPHEVYKIAHHGSENGDHDEIWQKLLERSLPAALTPFRRQTKLPTDEDCKRLRQRTSRIFMTAPTYGSKYRDPNRATDRTMKEAARYLEQIPGKFGLVRMRSKVADPKKDWTVDVFGDALRLE